jgi:carbonic anhydrase
MKKILWILVMVSWCGANIAKASEIYWNYTKGHVYIALKNTENIENEISNNKFNIKKINGLGCDEGFKKTKLDKLPPGYAEDAPELLKKKYQPLRMYKITCQTKGTLEVEKPEQGRSNIDEAKAVCKELGYKTGSERFADCSLRILEININAQNSQQQAQMLKSMAESAEKSAKAQKIANLIRASRNLNQMYLDLSRQNASSGTTSLGTVTCRVYGTGANKRIQCY